MAASSGRTATAEDSETASDKIERLMERLRLARHKQRDIFGRGLTVVDHLGFRWDSVDMESTVHEAKQDNCRAYATRLLNEM